MALLNFSPATWNTLGLSVAACWAGLSMGACFDPHRTAELFGITALRGEEHASRTSNSALGFSGVIGSRDMTFSLALFTLGRLGRNDEMGIVILSTMCICATDVWLVWRKREYVELAALAIPSAICCVIGLGLRGYFD